MAYTVHHLRTLVSLVVIEEQPERASVTHLFASSITSNEHVPALFLLRWIVFSVMRLVLDMEHTSLLVPTLHPAGPLWVALSLTRYETTKGLTADRVVRDA
jgi:hypothetical protein